VVAKHGFEAAPKRRDVPPAFAELEEKAAVGPCRVFLENFVEAAAGGEHPKPVVEHEEGLGKGVDDRQRQRLGIGQIVELPHEPAPSGGSTVSLSHRSAVQGR
jgi:hypothetical protein